MEVLREKQKRLQGKIKNRFISYGWHDPELSLLEAVFARGDRRVGKALVRAWERGCKFDSWGEHFKYGEWLKAFEECGLDPHFYANRKREYDEVLPWEHIDVGVSRKFLMRENERARKGELTPNCRVECTGCGAAAFGGGICVE
jgi:hypothetical protein